MTGHAMLAAKLSGADQDLAPRPRKLRLAVARISR
jgi:hypothetical protein